MNVKGKSILITGGAGGLGSVMAKLLAKNGATIFILDLPVAEKSANELIAEIEKEVEAAIEAGMPMEDCVSIISRKKKRRS